MKVLASGERAFDFAGLFVEFLIILIIDRGNQMDKPKGMLVRASIVAVMATGALFTPGRANAATAEICDSVCVDYCPGGGGEGDAMCQDFYGTLCPTYWGCNLGDPGCESLVSIECY